jgi:hypothetical protein
MKRLFLAIVIASIVLSSSVNGQLVSLDGIIVDAKTGELLKEVSVFDNVSGIGTISDQDGYFKLLLGAGDIRLTLSEDGYKSLLKEFSLNNDTVLDIRLTNIKGVKSRDSQLKTQNLQTASNSKGFFKRKEK